MKETYSPTKREIVSWMCGSAKMGLRTAVCRAGKFGAGFLFVSASPYTAATHTRVLFDWESYPLNAPSNIFAAGATLGIFSIAGQFCAYVNTSIIGHPEVLLIPVATNIASGAYELGRYMYRSARRRVSEEHKPDSLESKFETENPAQQ